MNDLNSALVYALNSKSFRKTEVIQELWSGYGEIARYVSDPAAASVIVKVVTPEETTAHPRGWNTQTSHQRKLSSYMNERHFYQYYAQITDQYCRVPQCIAAGSNGDNSWLIMEDLDHSGFLLRWEHGALDIAKLGLRWLANFHARFLQQPTDSLWPVGTYWHLKTRPDELLKMSDGPLKTHAHYIDNKLNQSSFQTLVHGDAQLANFCFKPNYSDLAAVDFQYVGKGVGVKDVMYFLGSCLDEDNLFQHGSTLLDYYFEQLIQAVQAYQPALDTNHLEHEWRALYAFAWADFERFLLGWMPTHYKLNGYSKKQTQEALTCITR